MIELLQSAEYSPGLVAMLCLMLASGFFSGSETALFYLSHDELRRLRGGGPGERLAASLLGDPDRLLTGILFWNLVINLSYFAVSVVLAQRLTRDGMGAAAGALGLVTLFGIIVFGEVLPKSMAVVFSRPLASLVSWPVAGAVRLLDPIVPALTFVTRLAHRTFWPHIPRESPLTPEDLERAVEASELSPDVVRQERQVLHNVLELSDVTVEEVMRPRGTYLALAPPIHLAELKGEVPAGDYICVRRSGTEDIVAAIPLAGFASLPEDHLERGAEEVVHVPWCARLEHTLATLRERFCSVASVVNEYGETIGIVTFDDLIDNVLMSQPSRARRIFRREPIVKRPDGSVEVEGITTLRFLCRRLGIEYEPESEDYVTVAGMLSDKLEHIPEVGDECEWRGYRVRVTDVPRPGQVRVSMRHATPAED